MAAKFDNLDDVVTKFSQTICYYEGKPCYVKQVLNNPEKVGDFLLYINHLGGRGKHIALNDPAFDYKNYNIGYTNAGPKAVWWFRRPIKQYRQGLKKDQVDCRVTPLTGGDWVELDTNFNWSKPYVDMLENIYPEREAVKELLMDGKMLAAAFHRDFAISWDKLHEDYILEYRGKNVGVSLNPNLTDFRLIPEAKYLEEALKEATHVRA